MTQITISAADSILSRYGNQLVAVGKDAPAVLARGLNRGGDKTRTQVRRALVRQTGIKYGQVQKGLSTIRATQYRLTYALVQRGGETNLNLFNARQTSTGVSATPWGQRNLFPHAFLIARYGNKVFIRVGTASDSTAAKLADHGIKGTGRFPIRQLFGPNLARELVKGQTAEAWQFGVQGYMVDGVGHELGRALDARSTKSEVMERWKKAK